MFDQEKKDLREKQRILLKLFEEKGYVSQKTKDSMRFWIQEIIQSSILSIIRAEKTIRTQSIDIVQGKDRSQSRLLVRVFGKTLLDIKK